MEENDEQRRELIHKFYQIYRPIQKSCGLREHSHFDIYGNNPGKAPALSLDKSISFRTRIAKKE